jgi:hypothetical protein
MAETTNETLPNLDIRDFTSVSGLESTDNILLVLAGGAAGQISVGLFKRSVSKSVKPSIQDGYWWIGDENTEVQAEGTTPEFQKGELGVYWKYTTENDSYWRLLVNYTDIAMKFEDLTDEQRQMLIPHLSDLTEDEIAELQKPANDMIAVLKQTNQDVSQAENARAAAESSRVDAESQRVTEFATLKKASEESTDYANEVAQHPTYVGEDNYVYVWNHTTQTFDKTSKLVKAGGLTIDVIYSSVAELEADTRAWNDGLFAMVNTNDVENPEDARLYIRHSGKWDFVCDMSGAIGLTGKTPQFFIGTISLGKNLKDAAVSLSYAGKDDDGNPKYDINYTIPRLTYDDLTEEQIAELQKPANDMIAVLKATNQSVTDAESKRVTAEDARAKAESSRVTAESGRVTAENKRVTAENTRVSQESARVTAETERQSNEEVRKSNETERQTNETTRKNAEALRQQQYQKCVTATDDAVKAADKANTAATTADTAAAKAQDVADHPTKMGDNGNWWQWNADTQQWEDTGVMARGGLLYPTFYVDSDFHLQMSSENEMNEDMIKLESDGHLYVQF